MSPDSPETRIGRLEMGVAKLEQRVEDLALDVKTLTPLVVSVAEMRISLARIEHTQEDQRRQSELREAERRTDEKAREKQHDAERKEARRTRNALVVGCLTAILTPVGAIIAAVLQ